MPAGNFVRVGVGVGGVGKASSDLDKLRDKFEKLQKGGAKGFAIGVGAAVTTAAFGLLDRAAGALIGVFADGIRYAKEDERSIAQLGASLKANIPNWDGNTKAIEATVKAHINLGFADEDTRASLALLVGATHDVNKAFAIQATAMDLARFKNISLGDATTALTRVEAGSYRILKSLGIVLKDGATQAEALAAVQKIAGGQAEAYANTIEGRTLVAQIKLNETEERFGRAIMPLVSDALDVAATALDAFNGILDQADVKAKSGSFTAKSFGDSWLTSIGSIIKAGQDAPWPLGHKGEPDWDHLFQVAPAAEKAGRDMKRVYDGAAPGFKTTVTAFYKPVWKQFDVAAFKAEQSARELPGLLAQGVLDGVDEIDSAMDVLIDELKNPPDPHAELIGKLYSKKLARGLVSENPYARAQAEKLRRAILEELAAHYFFTGGVNAGRSFSRGLPVGAKGGLSTSKVRAKGGPVTKGEAYIVGEERAEVFVPNQSGTILPKVNDLPKFSGGDGGGFVLNLTVNAAPGMTPAAARQLGDAVGPSIYDYLYRRGAVGRVA